MIVSDPLRFVFSGHSIWLEVQQFDGDLSAATQTAGNDLGVLRIPAPHATALYGVCDGWPEAKVQELFRETVLEKLFVENDREGDERSTDVGKRRQSVNKIRQWPPLRYKGYHSETEFAGVNGRTMVRTKPGWDIATFGFVELLCT